ncbi:RDD family protein [Clostridium sp. MSJ-8]|uniref:RDD family protein n=1 Tax=Clostridium sp. MSJ-8 TaxID=2841510 RepID=UPI001C0F3171|nr:RDD family protein [Clostridium sp. MSJ-8]MBU5486868.1 RDD family protein [Clostridium sp. MSJ-8]
MKKLLANIIDQIIVFGVAILLLLLVSLVMKLIGFEFQKPIEAYIGSVAIVAILYYPIVEATALKTTLGKKLLNV